MKRAIVTLLGLMLLHGPLWAHGQMDEQISILSAQIKSNKSGTQYQALLYLKRAQRHVYLSHFRKANSDILKAKKLAPSLNIIDLSWANLQFAKGAVEPARASIQQFLKNNPRHEKGLALSVQIHQELEKYDIALQQLDILVELKSNTSVEYYVQRARLQQNLKRYKQAISGLEQGIIKLGSLAQLQELALEIEIESKAFSAALARIDAQINSNKRLVYWHVKKSAVYQMMGETEKAITAYQTADLHFQKLPRRRQNIPAMQALKRQIDDNIVR